MERTAPTETKLIHRPWNLRLILQSTSSCAESQECLLLRTKSIGAAGNEALVTLALFRSHFNHTRSLQSSDTRPADDRDLGESNAYEIPNACNCGGIS
jgi:hypothetical protein